MTRPYQICTRCVMDTTAVETVFLDDGTCNFCTAAMTRVHRLRETVEERKKMWEQYVEEMKKNGKGRPYDCVIGVSGGIDSSWVACLTKEWGLRALAVHVDTGWNLELAVHNVKHMLETLGIDLETIVVDWEAFRRLQVAFLRSSTPDNDGPTDNMIVGGVYQAIRQHRIRYYLPGDNPYTENVLPDSWGTGMYDWRYMRSVNKKFDPSNRISHLPHVPLPQYILKQCLNVGLKVFRPLHYLQFDRAAVAKHLLERFDWKFYGAKHYESLFTKFDQGYILVKKFNFDKRRAHLASLISSGMTTREEALAELEKPAYPEDHLEEDIDYFCQKLNITREDFEGIMKAPPKTFNDYPTNRWFFDLRRKPWIRPVRRVINAVFTPQRKASDYSQS